MSELPLSDHLNIHIDRIKLDKLVDTGKLDISEIAHAPIISESYCCNANLKGVCSSNDVVLTCSKCGALHIS